MIELKLYKPNYFLMPINDSLLSEYALGFSLGDIFKVKGKSILTGADELLVNTKLDKLKQNINEYMRSESNIQVGEFTKKQGVDLNGTYKTFSYRVFDNRYYYSSKLINTKALLLTKHESIEDNYYLNFKSTVFGNEKFSHIYISKNVADNAVFTGQKPAHSAPLYIYNEQNKIESIENNHYLSFLPIVPDNEPFTHCLITKTVPECKVVKGKQAVHSAPLYIKENSND